MAALKLDHMNCTKLQESVWYGQNPNDQAALTMVSACSERIRPATNRDLLPIDFMGFEPVTRLFDLQLLPAKASRACVTYQRD